MAHKEPSGPRIYTRTGDDGTTGLLGGRRTRKDTPHIQVLGDLDELNSALGLVLAEDLEARVRERLTTIQKDLFVLGAELAGAGPGGFPAAGFAALEHWIDELDAELPVLKAFILPGGSRASALCHHARAVCRRAERALVALADAAEVSDSVLRYVNRLSDLLFVTARHIAYRDGQPEVQWLP